MATEENFPWGDLPAREREARKALVGIIATGRTPDVGALAGALGCSRAASRRLLDALVAKGCVVREGVERAVVAAYPLSARPTRHRVTLGAGQRVHAMCAMDALGISPLFGRPAAIESACPHCNRTIRLMVREGEILERDPPGTTLWYARAELLEGAARGVKLAEEH